MKARPLEVKALVPLLERDWDSPEELAKALIETLDETRASRTTYIGVAQYGDVPGTVWYAGVGPWPGRKSAERALKGDPAASLATALAVVPLTSPEGLRERLERVDAPPKKGEA